jgi:hypothetical protein
MPTTVAQFKKSFGPPSPATHSDDGRTFVYFDPSPQYGATWSMAIQATIDPATGNIVAVCCGE